MNKGKLGLLILLIFIAVGSTLKIPNSHSSQQDIFSLNKNTAIIDVMYGTENADFTPSSFWGSVRNTKDSAVDDVLNALDKMDYTQAKPQGGPFYYFFVFNGQVIADQSTFKIYLSINPDNYNIYLDKVESGGKTKTYHRLYMTNSKIKQEIKDILQTNR